MANKQENPTPKPWQTKPTDRFVLRWIKLYLAAPLTQLLVRCRWLRPWMITISSAILGITAGVIFAYGQGVYAGLIAACAQILDGTDGQLARLTGVQSRGGAFWDSVLDRYADGALMIGLILYLTRQPPLVPIGVLYLIGALALIGSNLISYTSARADGLNLEPGPPTLASKGTRTSVIILCAWGSALWYNLPWVALLYLAIHSNIVVLQRLYRARRAFNRSL